MNKEELQALGIAAAKNIKTEQDLNEFRQILTKISVEAALNAELDNHLETIRRERDHCTLLSPTTPEATSNCSVACTMPGGRILSIPGSPQGN